MAEQDCDQPSRSTESAGPALRSKTGAIVRETIGPKGVHGVSDDSQSDPMITSTFTMIGLGWFFVAPQLCVPVRVRLHIVVSHVLPMRRSLGFEPAGLIPRLLTNRPATEKRGLDVHHVRIGLPPIHLQSDVKLAHLTQDESQRNQPKIWTAEIQQDFEFFSHGLARDGSARRESWRV